MEIKILQLHKKSVQVFDKIEDKVSINTTNSSLAISDGATQGFGSGIWAGVLTAEFISNPVFDKDTFVNETLKNSVLKYNSQIDLLPSNSNKLYAKLMEDKKKEGGYGTFLGIQILNNQTCRVIGAGDSNLFHFSGNTYSAFPSQHLEHLNKSVDFINTQNIKDNSFDTGMLKNLAINLAVGDKIFLVTDAIARYLFQNMQRINTINAVNNFEQLLAFAEENWQSGNLESDDLTIIGITVTDDSNFIVSNIIPPLGFQFNGNTEISYEDTPVIAPFKDTSQIKKTEQDERQKQDYDLSIARLRELEFGKKRDREQISQLTSENKQLNNSINNTHEKLKKSLIIIIALAIGVFALTGIAFYFGHHYNEKKKEFITLKDSIRTQDSIRDAADKLAQQKKQQTIVTDAPKNTGLSTTPGAVSLATAKTPSNPTDVRNPQHQGTVKSHQNGAPSSQNQTSTAKLGRVPVPIVKTSVAQADRPPGQADKTPVVTGHPLPTGTKTPDSAKTLKADTARHPKTGTGG